MYVPQTIALRGCEERMRDRRDTKVAHDASIVAAAIGKKAHLRMK